MAFSSASNGDHVLIGLRIPANQFRSASLAMIPVLAMHVWFILVWKHASLLHFTQLIGGDFHMKFRLELMYVF